MPPCEQAEADVHLWLPDALKAARARIADHPNPDIPSWFMAAFVLAAAECLPSAPRPMYLGFELNGEALRELHDMGRRFRELTGLKEAKA